MTEEQLKANMYEIVCDLDGVRILRLIGEYEWDCDASPPQILTCWGNVCQGIVIHRTGRNDDNKGNRPERNEGDEEDD